MRLNEWNKSTYSGASANCVETCLRAPAHPMVDLRDTQNREAGHLTFARREWVVLLSGARSQQH
ncbi:DUF397 domain-containing protein [Nocardiopsis quinghaiensis]|uniref:DUF397 domain-containing protein n=1 Tax=Nocardiopsis quinghaiensis TaxID=464995 RepID=UPI00123B8E51|nr:DUF397 domain-containing protein [Nocardiopsis quinghaiensis]